MRCRTKSDVRAQGSIRKHLYRMSGWLLVSLALLGAGCWLLDDDVPPVCAIIQPTDSSSVSGVVLVRAEATDSSGIDEVEFYVDGVLLAVDDSYPYETSWNTEGLESGSWHRLQCRAKDIFGNEGSSNIVHVQIAEASGRSIFHGRFKLPTGYYWPVPFAAAAGDTLAGEFRIAGTGVLSRFLWLTAEQYRAFAEGRSYSPLLQENNRTELMVRALVARSDSFYLVFMNTSGAQIDCWVRFSLE